VRILPFKCRIITEIANGFISNSTTLGWETTYSGNWVAYSVRPEWEQLAITVDILSWHIRLLPTVLVCLFGVWDKLEVRGFHCVSMGLRARTHWFYLENST
jgi:hypothetical protein